jgi:SAM-dependent methyltransferase
MDVAIRFSALVRKGLTFRRRFEEAKQSVGPVDFSWYPYDCFVNLFPLQRLLRDANLSLAGLAGDRPVLDVGAADGALSFFLESLGFNVHAVDFSGSNMNRMQGLRRLAGHFGSRIEIQDADLDGRFELPGKYSLALFLGTLYHLKNPYYALEYLARRTRFCFVSTRVARFSPDRRAHLENLPVAYLLDAAECNGDITNYWIFSRTGLTLLAKRTGWTVRSSLTAGATASDPTSSEADERMFLLLESTNS